GRGLRGRLRGARPDAPARPLASGLVGVRVLRAVAAGDRLPRVGPIALRAGRERLEGLHLELVAAVRALVGAGRDVAADGNGIRHESGIAADAARKTPKPADGGFRLDLGDRGDRT